MPATFSREDVRINRADQVYNGFFKIRKFELQHRLFAGGWSEPFTRELFVRGEAAAVFLYDPAKDKVVMIEQFRIGAIEEVSPWLTEIVAGVIEEGETPRDVVVRETEEEAGCQIKDLVQITRYFPSAGGSSEAVHLFCGLIDSDGVSGVHGKPCENEDIRVVAMDFDEAFQMISTGEIRDAASIIALQWLMINRDIEGNR